MPNNQQDMVVDRSSGVQIGGTTYYPLPAVPPDGRVHQQGAILNPCAGKPDDTYCGPGCICRAGQRWYTVERLLELGFTLSN